MLGFGTCRGVSKTQPQTIQIDLHQPLGAISAALVTGSCAFSADVPPPSIHFLCQQTDLHWVKILSSISLSFPTFSFWDRNNFHKLYKSSCYDISLAWPIGLNNLQGIFRDHLILCLKLSWLTFREYPSPLCLSVSQCLLTQTSQMVFQSQFTAVAGIYRKLYMWPRDSSQLTHQTLIL